MGFIELAPLCAELGVLGQQGHKVRGEGVAPGGGAGAEDFMNGNLRGAQVDFTADFHIVQQIVENIEIALGSGIAVLGQIVAAHGPGLFVVGAAVVVSHRWSSFSLCQHPNVVLT